MLIITVIRCVILYFLIIVCMRLMGKRQIGELQPSELVVTILLSEIISIPMQDNKIPMLNSLIAVGILVSFEILNSFICMKSVKLRCMIQGNSIMVIKNGVIDQKQLSRLRFTVDDIMDALRQKDVFDINEVQYAIVETNGTLSVMLKPAYRGITAGMLDIKVNDEGITSLVIDDGRIIKNSFENCPLTMQSLEEILKKNNVTAKEILMMTMDTGGNFTIVKRNEK